MTNEEKHLKNDFKWLGRMYWAVSLLKALLNPFIMQIEQDNKVRWGLYYSDAANT